MKLLKPDFYDGFACIASRCRDTCYAGWEIEVDEETLKKYREVPGNFGRLLRSRISEEEDGAYFALAPGRRCPFLNERNLCEIYLQLGEDMLCDICREHPRFYQWFGDYTEAGLGLCCEEVCRLLFQRKEPLRFVLEEQGNGAEEEDPLLKPLLAARERLFSILQNRTYPMDQRMAAALKFAERLDPPVRQEDTEEILKLAGTDPERWLKAAGTERSWYGSRQEILELLEIYRDLESLDGTWGGRMESLMEQLPELLEQRRVFLEAFRNREYEYEHLAVYVLYRYFMESLFDGCVLPPVRFAASSLLILQLMDTRLWLEKGGFSEADRIFTVKLYSKEIEYCPENMEVIRQFLEGEPGKDE